MTEINVIPIALKRRCVAEVEQSGKTMRQVYEQVFLPEHQGMSFETFRHKVREWRKATKADSVTLNAGTYNGFIAHGATVQVDANGDIRQAWIKQSADVDWDVIIAELSEAVVPYEAKQVDEKPQDAMLEIPLFDMHFGVATLKDYDNILSEILRLIGSKRWAEVNIIIGQDLIHNNDMRGHTAKGTPIEQISVPDAWREARCFWGYVIEAALSHSERVHIRYSKGNHDECISWAFVQMLRAMYPQAIFDDALKPRKAFVWQGCFIGYGHCEYTNKSSNLFRDFVCDFPTEFAASAVREIHAGHLHSESHDNGIMIRRLASAAPTDEWSSNNGYVGAHKRFQLFEWCPNRLKAIYYI